MKIETYNLNISDWIKEWELYKFMKFNFEEDLNNVINRMHKIKIKLDHYKNRYKKYILVGNGGSVNPFYAIYSALEDSNKKAFIVNSESGDLVKEVKKRCEPKETLVLFISKSGETSSVIFNYFQFNEYEKIILTSNINSTLAKIANIDNLDLFLIPKEISGRFSGLTETSLIPLYLLDIEYEKVIDCARKFKFKEESFKLAYFFFQSEKNNYFDLFLPIYSYRLRNFYLLISQLIHESFGKDGKGLTVYGGFAPETQHHTNQRYFGGRDNTCSLMIFSKDKEDLNIEISSQFFELSYKGLRLKQINNIKSSQLVESEYIGTKETSIEKGKPTATIEIDVVNYYNVINLLLLLYYFAVYSSLLRDVNPFDQPHVEYSKRKTIEFLKNGLAKTP